MKRLLLILLVLGLVIAFSSVVFAADVKFSGSYYAAGMYLDRTTFAKDTSWDGPSTAFYYQRLRVRTDVVVTPALSLVTRFDALERVWGGPRSSMGISDLIGDYDSAGSRRENENIAFDWVYINYASPIGVFTVGYQNDGDWGTVFADNSRPAGKIGWAYTAGGFTGMIQVAKLFELSKTAFVSSPMADADMDKYAAAVKYAWSSGEAGIKGFYIRSAVLRFADIKTDIYGVIPYAKAKFGPVTVQAEVDYYWGDLLKDEITDDKLKLQNLGVYVDALADFGMFYAGGTVAYLSGDKDDTNDKLEGGFMTGGMDWMPCLLMFNWERTYWAGIIPSYNDSDLGLMTNAWFFQARGGVRPLAALDLGVSVSYAQADEVPVGYVDDDYGIEVDVTATYKITNNLSYMLGVGYLFTGDYYKDYTTHNHSINDNYIVLNKLTLTF